MREWSKLLAQLKHWPSTIIGGHNVSADDSVDGRLRMKTETLVDKTVKGKREGRAINCKKTKCMVISKRDSSIFGLRIGDVKNEAARKI